MTTVKVPKLPFTNGLSPRVTAGVYRHRTLVRTNVTANTRDTQIASSGTLVIEEPRDGACKLRQDLWSYQEQNRGTSKTEKGKFPEIPYRFNANSEPNTHGVEDSVSSSDIIVSPLPMNVVGHPNQKTKGTTKETSVPRLAPIFLPIFPEKTFGGSLRRFRSEEELWSVRTGLRKSTSELDLRLPSLRTINGCKVPDSPRSLISILGKLPTVKRADIQSKMHGHTYNKTLSTLKLSGPTEIQPVIKSISNDTFCNKVNSSKMWRNTTTEPGEVTTRGQNVELRSNEGENIALTESRCRDKLNKEQGKSQKPFQSANPKPIRDPPSDVEADRQWVHQALEDGAIIDPAAYNSFARTTSLNQHEAESSLKIDTKLKLNRKEFVPNIPDLFNIARPSMSNSKCYPVFATDGSPVKKVGMVKPAKTLSKTKRPVPQK